MFSSRAKLLGYIEVIGRRMCLVVGETIGLRRSSAVLIYIPRLLMTLSQIPSMGGCMLWPTNTDGVRGQICACTPRHI